MKYFVYGALLTGALMMLLAGCKKYEDGPLIDLYSKPKRVQGRWYFDKVMIGENDSTSNYRTGTVEFGLQKRDWGTFVWSLNNGVTVFDPDNIKGGIWSFLAEKDSFQMKFIDLATLDSTFWNWKINRLAYNEFWIERHDKDSTRIYWQLWKFVY